MLATEPEYCPYCGDPLVSKEIEGRARAFCLDCQRVIWRNADPLVSILVQRQDQFLLVRHACPPLAGTWGIPGGHPEVDEPPREAIVRELEEETTLRVAPDAVDLIDVSHTRFGNDENGYRYYIRLLYTVTTDEIRGTPAPTAETMDVRFWSLKELSDENREIQEADEALLEQMWRA